MQQPQIPPILTTKLVFGDEAQLIALQNYRPR